jgi:hypothetical protein
MTATTLIQVASRRLYRPLCSFARPPVAPPSATLKRLLEPRGFAARLRQMADGAQVPAGPVSATLSPQPCCWSRVSPLLCGQAPGVCLACVCYRSLQVCAAKKSMADAQLDSVSRVCVFILQLPADYELQGGSIRSSLLTSINLPDDWNEQGRSIALCISISGHYTV